jgi:hypothetical protein
VDGTVVGGWERVRIVRQFQFVGVSMGSFDPV